MDVLRPYLEHYETFSVESNRDWNGGREDARFVAPPESPIRLLAERAGRSWSTLDLHLNGHRKWMPFEVADDFLIAADLQHLWYAPPLLEHYDRVLIGEAVGIERKCSCGAILDTGFRVCPTCRQATLDAKHAKRRKPCRSCGKPKQAKTHSAYCAKCQLERSAKC